MIRRKKRKHCVRVGQSLRNWTAANQEWALDFAHDAVACGRAIRVLSVVDAYTRECLALEVDTSFASRRVTPVLEQIVAERGQPQAIRCDNGPELTSRHFLAWQTPTSDAHFHSCRVVVSASEMRDVCNEPKTTASRQSRMPAGISTSITTSIF